MEPQESSTSHSFIRTAWQLAKISLALLCLTGISAANAAKYFVAPNGNNKNPGTKEAPFQSISRGIKELKPGDTLLLRQGIYQESVSLNKSGTPEKPITIQANGMEYVEISGLQPLNGKWRRHDKKRNIYVMDLNPKELDREIRENNFQVFIDKQPLMEARWPNGKPDEILTRKAWQAVGRNSSYGRIDAPFLKGSEMDIEGADIVLNVIHQFFTWSRKVTAFDPDEGVIEYPPNLNLSSMFFKGFWAENGWWDDYFYLNGKYTSSTVRARCFSTKKPASSMSSLRRKSRSMHPELK